jgi:hypothetical protein
MRASRLFYSYSSRDEKLRTELDAHLAPLEHDGLILPWSSRAIPAGTEWDRAIRRELESADIILLLISATFMQSDYIRSVELSRALERHERGDAVVIPVILRPCDWKTQRFARLQALPPGAAPVTSRRDRHRAWTEVVLGVRQIAERLSSDSSKAQPLNTEHPEPAPVHTFTRLEAPPEIHAEFERKASGARPVVTRTYKRLLHFSVRMYICNVPPNAVKASYKLHPTFRPQVRYVERAEKPDLTLWIETYGDFEIQVAFLDSNDDAIGKVSQYLAQALERHYGETVEPQIAEAIDTIRDN